MFLCIQEALKLDISVLVSLDVDTQLQANKFGGQKKWLRENEWKKKRKRRISAVELDVSWGYLSDWSQM